MQIRLSHKVMLPARSTIWRLWIERASGARQRDLPAGLASDGMPLIARAHDEAMAIRVGIGANITANI